MLVAHQSWGQIKDRVAGQFVVRTDACPDRVAAQNTTRCSDVTHWLARNSTYKASSKADMVSMHSQSPRGLDSSRLWFSADWSGKERGLELARSTVLNRYIWVRGRCRAKTKAYRWNLQCKRRRWMFASNEMKKKKKTRASKNSGQVHGHRANPISMCECCLEAQ